MIELSALMGAMIVSLSTMLEAALARQLRTVHLLNVHLKNFGKETESSFSKSEVNRFIEGFYQAIDRDDGNLIRTFSGQFIIAPLIGALWGAGIGALIHFTANGFLITFVFGIMSIVFEFLTG